MIWDSQEKSAKKVRTEDTEHIFEIHVKLDFCTFPFLTETEILTPSFRGNGHLYYSLPKVRSLREVTNFSLELKTSNLSGVVLWIGRDLTSEDYLGIGLRSGMLHLVWNLGWFSRTELTVPKPRMDDGRWHEVKVDRFRQNLELRVDGEVFGSQVKGSYFELNTDHEILIGWWGRKMTFQVPLAFIFLHRWFPAGHPSLGSHSRSLQDRP